ncbi:MAG TPA: hypothetical protein VFQ72_04130 [Candidatus Paceibacterota bacterium]|nr:hypothetical protein [Candidatus Paceibacterota bacterium]
MAALHVLRERIDVVFREAEFDGEHHLSLRCVLAVAAEELEAAELASIEKEDDAASVEAVPRKAVSVPCQDAVGFAGFDSREHLVENRTARSLRGLLLFEFLDDDEAVSFDHLPKLGELRLNGANLSVFRF